MTETQLFKAIDQTAQDLGLKHWNEVKNTIFVPDSLSNLASVMWVNKFPENENTILIREQLSYLWYGGALKFDKKS